MRSPKTLAVCALFLVAGYLLGVIHTTTQAKSPDPAPPAPVVAAAPAYCEPCQVLQGFTPNCTYTPGKRGDSFPVLECFNSKRNNTKLDLVVCVHGDPVLEGVVRRGERWEDR